MKFDFLTLVFFVFSTVSWAQTPDFNDYKILKSSGPLPSDVTITSTDKFQKEMERIRSEESNKEARKKKSFLMQSRFYIDDMLRSGFVLYNDPIGEYVNAVADKVFAHDMELRQKTRIYILRTTDVNAFSTDQGVIFVTLGMLAQLENEAQLAFVLAHEMVHFEKKHSLDLHLRSKGYKKDSEQGDVLRSGRIDKAGMRNRYSRDNELEADEDGLAHFLKSGYDLSAIEGVFDVLALSHLPFDDLLFEKSFFEDSIFTMPANTVIDTVDAVTMRESDGEENGEEEESESSHPTIIKRRAALADAISSNTKEGRQLFLVGKAAFMAAKNSARFETANMSTHEGAYHKSMYETYILLQSNKDSKFLRKAFSKAMYYQAKLRNEQAWNKLGKKDTEGEFQRFDRFLAKMTHQEFNILAVRYIWQQYLLFPDDSELKDLSQDILTELVHHHDLKKSWFTTEKPVDIVFAKAESSIEDSTAVEAPMSKAEKARKNKSKSATSGTKKSKGATSKKIDEYWQTAFAGFLNNTTFEAAWKEAIAIHEKREKREEDFKTEKAKKEREKEKRKNKKQGKALGIDKILVVNPLYVSYNLRKKGDKRVDLIQNAEIQNSFRNVIVETTQKIGLEAVVLDADNLSPADVEALNDIALLNEWFQEQVDFQNLSVTPGVRQEEIRALAKRYGTNSICFTGVRHIKKNASIANVLLLPTIFLGIPVIYLGVKAIKGEQKMLYYNVLYDAQTGAFEVVNYKEYKASYSEAKMNILCYDSFNQIKSPKRK